MSHEEDIGYLKAKAENTEAHVKTLFAKHDQTLSAIGDIHTLLKEHIVSSKAMHSIIEEDVLSLKADVDFCKRASSDYYSIKKIAIAFAGVATLVFSFFWKIVEKVFL